MSVATAGILYQKRESAAQLGTVVLAGLVLAFSHLLVMQRLEPAQSEPISLTIVAPPAAPEQIVEQVVPPQPVVERVRELPPVTDAPAEIAAPTPPSPQVAPPPPAPPVQNVQPAPTEVRAPQSSSASEGLFTQDVRQRIERKKVYPDTARDLGMTGEVDVLYELDRAGKLLRAEIVTSSGYKLLDQAALRAVRAASYQGFPEDAWVGASSKVFRTKLVFSIN